MSQLNVHEPRCSLELVARHEGFRSMAYCDACGGEALGTGGFTACACVPRARVVGGRLTIGYGTNLEVGITRDEAEVLLAARVRDALEAVRAQWPDADATSARCGALVDLVYNLGARRAAEFVQMWQAVIAQDWTTAAKELRSSRAYDQEPRRIYELARILETNEWPSGEF